MLRLYQSNRLEVLADQLADLLSQSAGSVFSPQQVVVQHPAMRRWLTLKLAERMGICANITFPLPANFIWQLFQACAHEVPQENAYSPAVLQWRLLSRLDAFRNDPRFSAVNAYLGQGEELDHYQLAGRIAELFDQYLIYRPDWITAWEGNESRVPGDEWQAALWRALVMDEAGPHWIHLLQAFEQRLSAGELAGRLPERVILFGISSLSPAYLDLLRRLAEQIDVHLYLVNPCQDYWTEIVPEQEQARQTVAANGLELYLDVGNPLLASLGRQGRDFFAAILELDPGCEPCFVESQGDTRLARLQREILNLEPSADSSPCDDSIRIHACHSPMREIEVLRDQLLDIFERHPELTPDDVVVMMPDIDSYAPVITALFSEPDQTPYLLFDIQGRSTLDANPALRSFFTLLDIPNGRMPASEVVTLLETASLRQRFGITDDALPLITRWIEQGTIRWGRDAGDLARLGLPERAQNSWQAGLDRLLLGYAMGGDEPGLIDGILPQRGIEGADAQQLGGLAEFVQSLFALSHTLSGSSSVIEWCGRFQRLLATFFEPEESHDELAILRSAIETTQHQVQQAAFHDAVGLALISTHLRREVESLAAGGGTGGSGIRFCSLTAMRGQPAAVVCLIGMNDGQFPREQRSFAFDLIAQHGRAGDRSRRADDRYLFLELLLAARSTLYISYTGQDQRDNSELPPSELVNELLDYLGRDGVLTRHPLQPFSQRYFKADSGLFSYSTQMCEAGQVKEGADRIVPTSFTASLSEPDAEWRQLSPEQLIDFFSSPARYLLRRRLGVRLDEGDVQLASEEPFELDYLSAIQLQESLLESGHGKEVLFEQEMMAGRLPHGEPGRVLFDSSWSQAESLRRRIEDLKLPLLAETASLDIDLQLAGLRLSGQLHGVTRSGLVNYSPHRLWANQHIEFWLRHLMLNAAADKSVVCSSLWLDSERLYTLPPIESACERLEALVDCYWRGLREPLHLFPKSSLAYAAQIQQQKTVDQALKSARICWYGNDFSEGESFKPYFQLAFGQQEVLDAEFEALSHLLFLPYLKHRMEQ